MMQGVSQGNFHLYGEVLGAPAADLLPVQGGSDLGPQVGIGPSLTLIVSSSFLDSV